MPREKPQLFKALIRKHKEELGYSATDLFRLLFMDEEELKSDYLEERGLRLV